MATKKTVTPASKAEGPKASQKTTKTAKNPVAVDVKKKATKKK